MGKWNWGTTKMKKTHIKHNKWKCGATQTNMAHENKKKHKT